MAFNLLLSNLTPIAKAKKPLCQLNLHGYFFQFATFSRKLEPRPKVAKLFCQWHGGDRLYIGYPLSHKTLNIDVSSSSNSPGASFYLGEYKL